MQKETLSGLREQSYLSAEEFAARLKVTPEELAAMEDGSLEIPERIDPDAFKVVGDTLVGRGVPWQATGPTVSRAAQRIMRVREIEGIGFVPKDWLNAVRGFTEPVFC